MSDRRTRNRETDDGTYPEVVEELQKVDARAADTALAEFTRKFNDNTRYSGFGLETTIHMPCGFCAEPDFLVARILEVEAKLREDTICKHCGRGLRTIFTVDQPGHKEFQMVQFCGPDAPSFLPPIPRVEPQDK